MIEILIFKPHSKPRVSKVGAQESVILTNSPADFLGAKFLEACPTENCGDNYFALKEDSWPSGKF